MADKIFIVGAIGHREIKDQDAYYYAQLCCHKTISILKKKYISIKAISAIAEGADSLFAQTAISLDVKFDSIIPFEEFMSDFQGKESYTRCESLRIKTASEDKVNFTKRSSAAYRKSMEWVVFKSNLVVAIWDGKEIGSKGGTWEAISLCKKLKKQFLHIDVTARSMNIYFNNGAIFSKANDIEIQQITRYIQ